MQQLEQRKAEHPKGYSGNAKITNPGGFDRRQYPLVLSLEAPHIYIANNTMHISSQSLY